MADRAPGNGRGEVQIVPGQRQRKRPVRMTVPERRRLFPQFSKSLDQPGFTIVWAGYRYAGDASRECRHELRLFPPAQHFQEASML